MPARVTPLPGLGCRHYRRGRCLIEEHRNPGLAASNRCLVLERLGRAFDDFLLRAENLSLTEGPGGQALGGPAPGHPGQGGGLSGLPPW